MFSEDLEDLNLNDNICDLHCRLWGADDNAVFKNIKKLDVLLLSYQDFSFNFSIFPNVENMKARFDCRGRGSLDSISYVEPFPTSLVKLSCIGYCPSDLSYLTSLKELVIIADWERGRYGPSRLPQSIVRLEVIGLEELQTETQSPNLKELKTDRCPTNNTLQHFPCLKFIHLKVYCDFLMSHSPLSPTELYNQGLITSIKLCQNSYLVELSSFPWWIQYSVKHSFSDSIKKIFSVLGI
ncbi:hypothetical protein P9112_011063 [Eukaryota sp. TZLM1-RC]